MTYKKNKEMTFMEFFNFLFYWKGLFISFSIATFLSIVLYYFNSSDEPLYRSNIVLTAPTLNELDGSIFSIVLVSRLIEEAFYSEALRARFFDEYNIDQYKAQNDTFQNNYSREQLNKNFELFKVGDDFSFNFKSSDLRLSDDLLMGFFSVVIENVQMQIIEHIKGNYEIILKDKIHQLNEQKKLLGWKYLDLEPEQSNIKKTTEDLELELDSLVFDFEKNNGVLMSLSNIYPAHFVQKSTFLSRPYNIPLIKTIFLTAFIGSLICGFLATFIAELIFKLINKKTYF
jgi:hypothetical protein